MKIEVHSISKSFGSTKAINELSLSLDPGVIGLVGENGAGKSTLFRLLSGVMHPDKGVILIDGFEASTVQAKEKIFYLSDDPYAEKDATPASIYNLYSCFYKIDKEGYLSLLNELNLPLNKKIATFSKGMKRQTFIALSLNVDTEIMLLDEAFDGLDPLVVSIIKEKLLLKAEEGKLIFIASHNISTLDRLCERFVLLYKGSLAVNGQEQDMASSMVKYQAAFKGEFSEGKFKAYGFEVISYQKLGSIHNFVIKEDETRIEALRREEEPILLEQVPIAPDEAIALRMALARKESKEGE